MSGICPNITDSTNSNQIMKRTILYIFAVLATAFSASAQVVDQHGHAVDTTAIYGERADSLDAAVFVSNQAGNYLSKIKEVRTEVISAAGLCKMACCNLAESFENSASVTEDTQMLSQAHVRSVSSDSQAYTLRCLTRTAR